MLKARIASRWTMLVPTLTIGLGVAFSLVHCGSDENAQPGTNGGDASTTSCATDGGTTVVTGDAGAPVDSGTIALDPIQANAQKMITEGRQTFRFDTFGDEAFWGDTLHLHDAIKGSAKGGVGPGLKPTDALGAGLKVDVDALPTAVVDSLKAGKVDLTSVDTTLLLLQANAVVGVKGIFDSTGAMTSIGINCSLCHSSVDDSLAPGVGHRLDGWANRDLNVGAIIAMAPNLTPVDTLLGAPDATVRAVLNAWGPGKFNAGLFIDGKALGPDGGAPDMAASLIPPAFGLAGVNLATWTGFGSATYWNAFVANLEMHGQGTFIDSRLSNATDYPVAAANNLGNVRHTPDLITSKLGALEVYQLAIPAPTPPAGSFDATAAARGETVFEGAGKCASCHVAPLFTEPGYNMH
ncbi:MAG: hypothetical protein ABI551_14800, partial [Polyangiaceae bacterium]